MSSGAIAEDRADAPGGIGVFENWLSVWVALAIAAGLILGNLVHEAFSALAALEVASVNLVVAVLIWAMVYPMMVAVDFASLAHIGDRPKGLVLTIVVNWLVKPFTMAALAVLFFEHLFAAWIAPADAQQYIAGLILLGAAPCTAMVFVWSQLTRGDADLHASSGVGERRHHDLRLRAASSRSCSASPTSRCRGRR